MRVYRRDGSKSWQAEWYEGGVRRQRSTRCRDKAAAEAIARQWEREGADPAGARARKATLREALELLVDQRQELADSGKRSPATVEYYVKHFGKLLRIFGEQMPLAHVTNEAVARYVSARRREWANDARTRHVSEHTIHKEVSALGAALNLAKRRGLFVGDIEAVLPGTDELSPEYKPRRRYLQFSEVAALLTKLPPDRAAQIAFMVGVGAERGAVERAQRSDVRDDCVLVRGTKRPTRWRQVPLAVQFQKDYAAFALANGEGEGGMLFRPWANMWRDLAAACEALGFAKCSANDLRRTFGTWLRSGGASTDTIGAAMGHVDSTMAQRVYAKLDPRALAHRLREEAGEGTVTYLSQTPGHSVDSLDSVYSGKPLKASVSRCRRSDLNQRPWDYDSPWLPKETAENKRNAKTGQETVTHMSRPGQRLKPSKVVGG